MQMKLRDWKEKVMDRFERIYRWLQDNGDLIMNTFIGFMIGLLLAACLVGCKSEKTVVKTVYNYKDSTVVHTVYDTTHIILQDTVRVEVEQSQTSEDGTTVVFVDGGGTYNAQTGEYSGVVSIKQQSKSESNSRLSAEWQHKAEEWKATADSLRAELTKAQQNDSIVSEKNTADIKPKTSGWHKFVVWWFWIPAVCSLAT